jgi:hypothetical protein
VIGAIRHSYTSYDELLMAGVERISARDQVRDAVEDKLASWSERNEPDGG